jgi:hypothetical protein
MKSKTTQIIFFLIAIIALTSGCTDVVKNNVSNQSTDIDIGPAFEKIDLNLTAESIPSDTRDRYELVAADPKVFERSASIGKMKLTVMDKNIELELKEIEIPNGVGSISLVNGPTVYASDIDDNTSIFKGHVVNSTGSNAWFIISRVTGNMSGQIDTGNESYHIWSTGETYEEKPICITYRSQPQSDLLSFVAIPLKNELYQKESSNVKIILTNIGNNTLNTWPLYPYSGYDLAYQSTKDNGYAASKCPDSSLALLCNEDLIELKPGESTSTIDDRGCWVLEPGEYRLKVTYHTGSSELITKPYWRGTIAANEVLIKVSDSIDYSTVHILPSYNATASEWLKTNASFVAQIVLQNSTAQTVIKSGGTIIGVINFCHPTPPMYSGTGCAPALVIRAEPYTYTFSVNESARKVIDVGVEIPRY